jgi:hypothetical protein
MISEMFSPKKMGGKRARFAYVKYSNCTAKFFNICFQDKRRFFAESRKKNR